MLNAMLGECLHDSFVEWDPAHYLADYYACVEEDEQYTLQFLLREFKKLKNRPVALEFGIGPTVHHILPLSPYVSEIHVADYLPANLAEVRKWQTGQADAHNWQAFTEYILAHSGTSTPHQPDIANREALTRSRITRYLIGDASHDQPLGRDSRRRYECLLSCYCADSATSDKTIWYQYMANILSLLKPGGLFVTAALRNSQWYRVGQNYFPSADVNEHDFERLFASHSFDMDSLTIQVENVPSHATLGYESIVLASGFLADRA
ncbi:MAG TPA: guanitoxin biosynthesis pre-guanitoxin forming N-methyltransferase GntF [Anaerolineales bacterium]|nr:guanitoxin biosynthesis pre-guanitoxin forming N-methyltransferase GntF [Anaerolineales bacterium]